MKINKFIHITALLLLLSVIHPQTSTCFAQGSLTPSGAPVPTMKTLDQIEVRTPISSAPFTITTPGSYYLTTNLTTAVSNAIVIAANGVTLDLSGFTISSKVANALNGGFAILLNGGLSDITILNGHIRGGVTNNGSGVYSGPGFAYGIYYFGVQPSNVLVSRVSVSGCLGEGIFLQAQGSTVVEFCTAHTIGSYGILASTVKNSVATDCGSDAIHGDQASDCRGESTGGYGVYATTAINCSGQSVNSVPALFGNTAQNCYGNNTSSGTGVSAGNANNCSGHSVSGYGLFASVSATACNGASTTGTGLYAYNASYCVGSSSLVSGRAIQAIIASGCIASSGTNSITYKYNMP